jgi:MFS family permease
VIASLLGPGTALGAIDVAVPALARDAGAPASAGLLLAALAIGTAAASLAAGRRPWRWPPMRRLALLQVLLALMLALCALAAARLELLGLALVGAGAALGALFVTLYLLVDELAPPGAGTRTFAWLGAANNAGIAVGAAAAGALMDRHSHPAGLWLAVGCAAAGVALATVAEAAR